MSPGEPSDDAAVFDFLDEFMRDLERGTRQPLTHYLGRYQGHEEAIAAEYFAELERAGLSSVHRHGTALPANGAQVAEDPERVGPYRLLRELGRGGQGAVWLAEDTRIARHVALKLLPAEFAALSQERRRRLQREAEVIARLDHPSLCAVLEARIDGDRPYIAMRYVEGATLGDCIARFREARRTDRDPSQVAPAPRREGALVMAPRSALEQAGLMMFFERAARALHAAHEVGVVHRDVKPQNVMVATSGNPVVLDFGQARDETSDSFGLTRSGDVLGTPAYMSPEQILGERSGVDRRTDVWSLGASLYEALTLERPFTAESVPALFMAIRGASLRDPCSLNPSISRDLAVVVATALEKDPALRYQTALDFAEDLRRVREYEPVRARPPSAWRIFRGWFQAHPAIAYSVLGSILALAIGFASSLYSLSEKKVALDYALGLLLAQRAETLLDEDPAAALALGIEAAERAPTYQTRASLLRALQACQLRTVIDGYPAHRALDCALSPDSERAAIALNNGEVRIHTVETGALEVAVPGERPEVRAVRFSPDGLRIAFLAADDLGRIADAKNGAILAEFAVSSGEARSIEYALHGKLLCAVTDGGAVGIDANDGARIWEWTCPPSADPKRMIKSALHADTGRVLLWSVSAAQSDPETAWLLDGENGRLLRQWSPRAGFTCAEFRRDGERFASGTEDGELLLWRSSDGAFEHGLSNNGPVRAVRFSPDGLRVLALLDEGAGPRAWMWYLASGASTHIEIRGERSVEAAFSPDGTRIAFIGADMVVRLWNDAERRVEANLRGLFQPLRLAWSHDGRRLATLTNGATVPIWYTGVRPDVYSLRSRGTPVTSACFSPDGERILTGGEDGVARVYASPSVGPAAFRRDEPEHGDQLFSMSHRSSLRAAIYSPDGLSIATASDDGSAMLWDAQNGAALSTLVTGSAPLAEIAFAPDGAYLAARSPSGEVFLCDPAGRAAARRLDSPAPVTAMAWLPDRAHLVTGHTDNALRTFDARDGALVGTSTWTKRDFGSAGTVALAVRGDGGEIAVACGDAGARFFSPGGGPATRKELVLFLAQSIAYNSNGTRLFITGGRGRGALRLQDLSTDAPLTLWHFHPGDVTGAAFSSDGRWMISTAREGGAFVRDARDGTSLAQFAGPGGACSMGAISSGQGAAKALAAFEDGSVWVWPLDPLAAATARQPRMLTDWEQLREKRLVAPLTYEPRHPAPSRVPPKEKSR